MPTINRDGVGLYYEVHGSGPPLLLTHGYSSTSQMWQGQIEALSEHHKLVLWDMRGHGRSDYPSDPAAYSEALTVADMAALLDEVGANRAIVGGLSLGGYMSLAFYRAHPERVSALLIIDTGPGFKKDDARETWNRRAHDTGDRFEREGLAVLTSASRERSTVSHRRCAVPRRLRLHGGENSRREKGSDSGRRPRRQHRSAAGVHRGRAAVPRRSCGRRHSVKAGLTITGLV
jgi:pimeloyl-ACP methyl ester carboxylesterase